MSKFQQNPAKNGRVLTKFNKFEQNIFVKFCSEQNPTNFNKTNKRRAKPTKRSKNEQTRTNARRDADFAAVRTRKRRRRPDRLGRVGVGRKRRRPTGGGNRVRAAARIKPPSAGAILNFERRWPSKARSGVVPAGGREGRLLRVRNANRGGSGDLALRSTPGLSAGFDATPGREGASATVASGVGVAFFRGRRRFWGRFVGAGAADAGGSVGVSTEVGRKRGRPTGGGKRASRGSAGTEPRGRGSKNEQIKIKEYQRK